VTGKNLTQSHVPNEPQFSFAHAKDRFQVPTRKIASPAPNLYGPKTNLNENFNSVFHQAQQTKIGQDKSSIIDKHYNMQKKTPGPGAYGRFSEFSGLT
jgi:hypothetical protein